ncbi:MAG: hypothetical protein PHY43_15845 [Verrucomicrobiales bacterium]|nr:hypothetical protein [Verrucomicrobiales bacterium]
MNDLTQKLIIALVIIPVLLGIFRTPKEMGIAAAAIGLALCFANLDKLKSFKAAGVEAELRTAVDKAYAAIEQLKDLGLSLSAPTVDELAVSGRMLQYLPLKHKLERVEKIAETLKNLGASPKEIEEACSTIYQRVTDDHMRRVLYSLRSSNPGKESLFEGLDDGKMDNFDKSKLENFIKDNKLKKSEETEESILDYDYFLKNKKLRREEGWQS